jgi:hypothetical protein
VLEELQDNDAIVVAELSRLGRSMLECMEILTLAARKGIRIHAIKGKWQLDQTIRNKIIAVAFSITADVFRPEIEGLLANGSTQKFIAQRYKTTVA